MITSAYARPWRRPVTVALGVLLVGLDNYVLVNALPALSARLRTDTASLRWVIAAYSLAWLCSLLPAERLGDLLGHRRLLLAGLALFGSASLAAALVTTVGPLIGLRAVMGASAAVIMSQTLASLATASPGENRSRAVAAASVAAMLGLPLGPLATGVLLTHFSWSSIFLLNLPITAAAMVAAALAVPDHRRAGAPPMDWPGLALSAAGVTALTYGVIAGPTVGWTSPGVRASLTAAALLLAAFARHELTTAAPLVELRLLTDRRIVPALLAGLTGTLAITGTLLVVAPFLLFVQHQSPLATGVKLLPLAVGVAVGGAVSERLTTWSSERSALTLGLLLAAAGQASLAGLGPTSGYEPVGSALGLLGIGLGVASPIATDTVLDTLPTARARAGSRLSRWFQNLGGALGAALPGSALDLVYRARSGGVDGALRLPVDAAAYCSGIRCAAGLSCFLLVLTALCVALLQPYRTVDEL
ncbi:MFS transporter [Kitasatospora sp. NPDC018058]|uniref:MFS transporter n=1 Tax=Kitasatospora sp. NPDC018058 TaxID=3364025 RepID=UPI0037BE8DEF